MSLKRRLEIYRQIVAFADSGHTNRDALIQALEDEVLPLLMADRAPRAPSWQVWRDTENNTVHLIAVNDPEHAMVTDGCELVAGGFTGTHEQARAWRDEIIEGERS